MATTLAVGAKGHAAVAKQAMPQLYVNVGFNTGSSGHLELG
jgi:hypothetical protein